MGSSSCSLQFELNGCEFGKKMISEEMDFIKSPDPFNYLISFYRICKSGSLHRNR